LNLGRICKEIDNSKSNLGTLHVRRITQQGETQQRTWEMKERVRARKDTEVDVMTE
jgi:hypothetical protein